jgi:protein-tyrosine-phosphatase
MTRVRQAGLGMLGLGIGYFIWYTPYSGLAKAMSDGVLPTIHGRVGGLVLLPASALGTLVAMPVTLTVLRWWHHAGRRHIGGMRVPFPGRDTAISAFWMALIIGTTTLNLTFPGVSIALALILMRVGTLIITPVLDLLRFRKIHWYSAVALGLCVLTGIIALADVKNYVLSIGAVASVLVYVLAYFGRFMIMSNSAKRGTSSTDRRYFVEEHIAAPVWFVAILGVAALAGVGPLRDGFTTFLGTAAAFPAFLIGVFYEGLFIFTSLIFLDRREYSFCVPVHVCSSLLAGVAASFGLAAMYGEPLPSAAQFVASATVILAALMLSYPTIQAKFRTRTTLTGLATQRVADERSRRQLLLFVCGGNAVRSPMAAAIAKTELATGGRDGDWLVGSAGVTVEQPGAGIAPLAARALRELNIPVPRHESRKLTRALCLESHAVFCMTEAQGQAIVNLAPELNGRVHRLGGEGDVAEPAAHVYEAYVDLAKRLQILVRQRISEIPQSGSAIAGS